MIATHSDQALALLVDPSPTERELLGALPYQANETVLHTDRSDAEASPSLGELELHLSGASVGRTTVTYDMNHLQRLHAGRRYLVTLNRSAAIDPAQVIYRTTYDHPVHTLQGLGPRDAGPRSAGAIAPTIAVPTGAGVSRDGVVSALRACERLGAGPRARDRRYPAGRRRSSPAASAIYEGWVTHRRLAPIENEFRYRVWMPLLDLDELPQALDRHPLWSARHPARSGFARGTRARAHRSAARGARPRAGPRAARRRARGRRQGPRQPPVSRDRVQPGRFVYLHAADGTLAALVAEVTNTPWGESHRYVAGRADGAAVRGGFASGSMSRRSWRWIRHELDASPPGGALWVSIRSRQQGRLLFEATLALRRRELTRRAMTRVLVHYPPSAPLTLARIYANALRLRLRGVPLHRHPVRGQASA